MPVFPAPSISDVLSRDGRAVVSPTTRAKNVVCLVKANNANARVNHVVSQAKAKCEESFDKREAQSSGEKGIFEISDTELASKKEKKTIIDNNTFGVFLEACSFCKRKLGQTRSLYMYGDLGAFCSLSCRKHKMLIDSFDKEFFREFPLFRAPPAQSKLLRAWHKVFG